MRGRSRAAKARHTRLCDAAHLLGRDFSLSKSRLKNSFNFVFSNGVFLQVFDFDGAPARMKLITTFPLGRYDISAVCR